MGKETLHKEQSQHRTGIYIILIVEIIRIILDSRIIWALNEPERFEQRVKIDPMSGLRILWATNIDDLKRPVTLDLKKRAHIYSVTRCF